MSVDARADEAADVHVDHRRHLRGERRRQVSVDRARVAGSTSAKRGRPPACSTAAAVAKKVLAGTTTSRLRPRRPPAARSRGHWCQNWSPPPRAPCGPRTPASNSARERAEGQVARRQGPVDQLQDAPAVLAGKDHPGRRDGEPLTTLRPTRALAWPCAGTAEHRSGRRSSPRWPRPRTALARPAELRTASPKRATPMPQLTSGSRP